MVVDFLFSRPISVPIRLRELCPARRAGQSSLNRIGTEIGRENRKSTTIRVKIVRLLYKSPYSLAILSQPSRRRVFASAPGEKILAAGQTELDRGHFELSARIRRLGLTKGSNCGEEQQLLAEVEMSLKSVPHYFLA